MTLITIADQDVSWAVLDGRDISETDRKEHMMSFMREGNTFIPRVGDDIYWHNKTMLRVERVMVRYSNCDNVIILGTARF